MKPLLRERALRRLYAALVGADFSSAEVHKVGEMLMSDRGFAIDLGTLLVKFSDIFSSKEEVSASRFTAIQEKNERTSRSSPVDTLQDAVGRQALCERLRLLFKKNRLSSLRVRQLLKSFLTDTNIMWPPVSGLTTKELINSFAEIADYSTMRYVVDVLEKIPENSDAYLNNIISKKRRRT